MPGRTFNVADYGAVPPTEGKSTAAFQQALDACGAAGGGVVYVPPGEYRLGRIHLRDHVTLHLEAGAVVRPSHDPDDIPPIGGHPASSFRSDQERVTHRRYSLIHGFGLRGVTLEGRGRIEGEGEAFWDVKNTTDEFDAWRQCPPHHYFTARPFRPMLVLLERCEDVVVRDVTLADAPCYAGWFVSCRGLRFSNVRVANNLVGPNTDGFHFSSCREVHIRDCDFVCGDDCIAIDANDGGPACDYTITGCTFNTTVNVFRIYTGLDPRMEPRHIDTVSNVVATGCTVTDASGVFNLVAQMGRIERVVASDFAINQDQRGAAFFLLTSRGGQIADVSLSNMEVRTDGLGTLSGEDGGDIRRVRISNWRYQAVPRTKEYGNGMPEPLPSYGKAHYAPYNLYLRHAHDIVLRDIDVEWGEADLADLDQVPGGRAAWSGITAHDVHGLRLERVRCPAYGEGVPDLELINSTLADD